MSWQYRRDCLTVFGYQVVLLSLGVGGLGLSGLAVDVVRRALDPDAPPPGWPLGFAPPPGASVGLVLAGISALVLVMAATRAWLVY
ncbi:MAG TPA: ABC transporter ATP-binding protein, partial [Polyangiaceae bacterium]